MSESLAKYIFFLMLIFSNFKASGVFADSKSKSFSSSINSEGPVLIKSDNLNLDSKDRIFTYTGNVQIKRGELEITTDIMVGQYAETQELETILCKGNVVVTRGLEMRATSNRAYYDVKAAKIELTEQPELNKNGNILAADKIIMYVDEDRSEAEGNVRVKVQKEVDQSGGGLKRMLKPSAK